MQLPSAWSCPKEQLDGAPPLPGPALPRDNDRGPRNNDLQNDFQIISIRTQRFAQEVQSGSEQKLFSFAFSV